MNPRTERFPAKRGGPRAGRLIAVIVVVLLLVGLFGYYSPIFL